VDESSLATDASQTGDRKFKFVLTHVGTNRNGDHFTAEELCAAVDTAVGKKIDLSHSQEFRDIVGGIVGARYVDAGDDSHVECEGELYTEESEPARLAYKLMKRKIVGYVSMECDYAEGECSVCGKKVKNKAEYCTHLKNHKGRTYQGKPVFEILHGITFTGMGLLDREGADEKAEIRQVADHHKDDEGGNPMGDETRKKGQEETQDPSEMSDEEKSKLIQAQQAEIERLTKEIEALQKKLDDNESSHKAMVRKAKAEKLINDWEEAGREFESDEARTAELDRLMKLTDEGFEATVATVQSFAAGLKKKKDDEDEPEDDEDIDPKTKKKRKPKKKADLSSDAGVSPAPSADRQTTLRDELSDGFMAAYQDRVGQG